MQIRQQDHLAFVPGATRYWFRGLFMPVYSSGPILGTAIRAEGIEVFPRIGTGGTKVSPRIGTSGLVTVPRIGFADIETN